MAAMIDTPALDAPALGHQPYRPLVALKAFRKLASNKEDTLQVFEIIRALSGRSIGAQYRRLLTTAEGGRQAYLREELADRFQDETWTSRFGEGTVGDFYRRFIAMRGLSAYGLADESRRLGEVDVDSAHPVAWFMRRLRDVHDVWHVLTGYGTDALGEVCVVAFTFAQTGNFGLGFLAVAGALELKRNSPSTPYFRAVYQAWRHGRRAAWLPSFDYDKLLAEPLADARQKLAIARPTHYEAVPLAARNAYRYEFAEAVVAGNWSSGAA